MSLDDAVERAHAGATLVTASRRLSRALGQRSNALQLSRGLEAWQAPAILPWTAWLSELWNELPFAADSAPVRLDERQERVVWERAMELSAGRDGLLQLAATAQAAAGTWELMQAWRVDATRLESSATGDLREFLVWARQFASICLSEAWLDAARATDYLASRVSSLRLPEELVLAGFDQFTPQQREFLEACRGAGTAVAIAQPLAVNAPDRVRTSFASRDDEIAAAARWARSLVEKGEAGIAVAIRNLEEVRERVVRAFAQALGPASAPPLFNMAAGPALASYPLVCAALLALGLAPEGNDFDGVSRLLRSPFLGGAESEWARRAALEAALRRGGNRVSVARIESLTAGHGCPALATALGAWRRERESLPGEQSPAAWARTFSTLLVRLGWPGSRPLASADYQTVEAWRDLLSDFAKLGMVLPRMTYDEALVRLKRLASARPFQPETELAPIQILGLTDVFGMECEHLWMAGFDDDHWPGPPKPAAFLPPALQRALGLPRTSSELELAFAQRLTGRLLECAPHVVVSHALHDGDCDIGPSPLIAGVPPGEIELPDYPVYLDSVRQAPHPEPIEDHAAPPFEKAAAPGGTRVFQLQAQCPFRAFAELRLAAQPLDQPAPGLSPMQRGTLVHRALETLWGRLKSHAQLCLSAPDEIEETVREAVAGAMASIERLRGERLPEAFAAIEQERLEDLLGKWLELEKRRAPFTVLESERTRTAEAGGVRCEVKIDRVDRLEDGRDVIVDYKSGHPTVSSWAGDRPDEPQLPLYAVSHPGQVAAVVFGRIGAREVGFRGYATDDGLVPGATQRDVGAEIEKWREVLGRLGAGFRAGVATVDPKDAAACRHCPLLALCRFSESETPAAALGDEDGDA